MRLTKFGKKRLEKRDREMLALYREGVSITRIAELYGLRSRQGVYVAIARAEKKEEEAKSEQ